MHRLNRATALGLATGVALTLCLGTAAATSLPSVPEAWVTDVTATSAQLRATINPEGLSTTYRFEYLTEAAYEANRAANPSGDGFEGAARVPSSGAAPVGSGTQPLAVSQHIASLTPLTAYRYRPVARSSAGTTIGPEHVLRTQAPTNVSVPLDGRAWEMVSPVDKTGGGVGTPEAVFGGGDFQAGAAGGSFTFSSPSSFGEAAGAPPASQYLSGRGGSGWTTANISAASEAGGYDEPLDGAPFRVFSADLSRAAMLNSSRCAVAGTCPPGYSLWQGGGFIALPSSPGLHLEGASPDLGHLLFSAEGGLYEWSGGGLETVSATPGARLAAPSGAISADGRRVYFSLGEDGPLYLGGPGASAKPLPETSGGAAFQAASSDGSVAYYLVGSTLYRYQAAGASSQSLGSGVSGVLGISAGGSVAYFQAAEGLRRWQEGTTTTILAGDDAALPTDYPPASATARLSADGAHLAFLSAAEVPPFDNVDADSGQPDTELYLYGTPPGGGAPRLACASCNPTGERPKGSASIPGAEVNGSTAAYRPRALAGSGNRVFFDTADRLVIGDSDNRPDVYEWEAEGEGSCAEPGGCVGLVSGGRSSGGRFVDASAEGTDVFFTTEESLVGFDPGAIDVYDYRAGGGFPEPSPPFACVGDACQPLPSAPEDPSPGTLVPHSGNPAPRYLKPRRHHKHKKRAKHRHRRRHHHKGKR
ncbi:MAG TPA: hypothetical protein VFK14_11790 [Solirubrobacterales bacterium]|nr:hypothetical protein [Solirubrobacterales bacterium]